MSSSTVESAKIHGDNPSGTEESGDGDNQQQTPVKRKRLTQACDACRKKKVKCSGEKPCNNCTRLGVACTYLPSTRKRGPRVGLVESLEKRLLQMERLLQPLKEQGLVDESDNQTLGPTVKKPRLNSTELYSADNFTDITNDQLYSNQNSSEPNSQSKGYITPSKDAKSHSDFLSTSSQFNSPSYTHSEQPHRTYSQSEFINYPSQSPQSSSSSSQLSSPVEHQSPVIDQQTKTSEESQKESVLSIKTENSDEGTFIFFGNTSAIPGFRNAKELESCHAKINVDLKKQTPTDTTSLEQTTSIMNTQLHVSPALMLSRQNEFPTDDIVDHLASCFFRHVDNQFPMFHEATFKRQLRQGKVPPFLVLTMCAVGARFSKHPRIKKEPPYMSGEDFAAHATQMIISSLDNPCVEHVQAFVLLTMHTYGSLKGPRSWMYIGMAIRMAQELGLHKIDDPSSNTSNKKDSESAFIRKETRRRTFWACFMLDRFSACALGRPTLIVEDDCDVRFPCVESIWTVDHPFTSPAIGVYLKGDYVKHDTRFNLPATGMFANFCGIITLLGRVSQYVNRSKPACAPPSWDPKSEFATLENELEVWYQKMVPQYGYSKERLITFNSTGYGVLFASTHLLYYAVVVVLNRPNFIALQNGDVPIIHKDFFVKSAERCSTAATHVTSIAADVIQQGIHYMCPFTLYPVFATATIHINDLRNEDVSVANAAKESLKIHEQYMSDMGPIWAMANKLCWMVKEMCNLRHEQSDSDCNPRAFFFNGKMRTQPRTELMSTGTDAGFMTFWNRTSNSTPESNNNNNSTLTMGFPDQLLSPRWFLNGLNDNSMVGDSWTNFLRSQLPVTPGSLIRFNKRDNGENDDYFSQDITLCSNSSNSSYIYDPAILDMPMSQTIPEWFSGRLMQANRQANKQWTDDIDPIIQGSVNQIPLSSSNAYRSIESSNIDDQGSSREFKTTHSQRSGEINLDPFIR